jgi:diacylglycerol kinase family enzyme
VRRVALIVNPFATAVSEERVRAVERALGAAGEVQTAFTERRGHATELARATDADVVVSFSGDGGFNEVLNGVDGRVPVGFVPGGGTSVLPRALGLPRDPIRAAQRIAAGRTRRISLGRVNGRRFAFSAGIGIDAEAVRRVDEVRLETGERPGDLSFAAAVLRTLAAHGWRYRPALEIVGYGDAAVLFVGNGRPYTYLGPLPLPIVPRAKFEAGLDLLAPRRIRRRRLPLLAPRVLAGRASEAHDVLYAHDLDRIEVRCARPLPLQADGEDLGDVEHVLFEAERAAVSVLV